MEIVYKTKTGLYPFNRTKDTEFTYVQHIISTPTSAINESLRQIARTYKQITCNYFIRLTRTLKDQQQTHFFYDYYPISLETYLKKQSFQSLKRIKQQLLCALKCLQSVGLKAFAKIQNIAVDDKGSLKMFIGLEDLEKGSGLSEFYLTQKKRLIMGLQQLWEKDHANEAQIKKQQKNPGFRIIGNQLIFGQKSKDNQIIGDSKQEAGKKKKKQEPLTNHSAEIILEQIKKRKQKTKQLKLKSQNLQKAGKEQGQQGQFLLTQGKKSNHSESQPMRQSHKSEIGLQAKKVSEDRLINSAAQTSNDNNYYCRLQDRLTNHLKGQKEGQGYRSQVSYGEVKEAAMNHLQNQGKQSKQQAKIQITTEMVSKYKMKIVTCQQIEFQGKEGEDIQKIAQQKLIQYQQQYVMPYINVQSETFQYNQEAKTRTTSDKSGSFEQGKQKKQKKKIQAGQSEQIMTKIWKAKTKAQNVLKQYAKTKQK